MIFTLVFRSICRLRWLRRHKSIMLAEILNFHGARPTFHVGSFSKGIDNLDDWDDFPDAMWGLGYEMDSGESFVNYKDTSGLKVKEAKTERENKRNELYFLEHADRQIVGNFLFSYWRYLTHWAYSYDEYDVDFLKRIIKILEDKY